LFTNSQLSHDPVVAEYLGGGNALAGDTAPNLAVLKERPEHRIMLYLKAQGLSNQEIADKCGYGYQWVCQIVRQPWFRKAFVELVEEAGKDATEEFLRGEVLNSLNTLVDIRDDTKSKEASRVAAANAILDRALGKPTQHIQTERIGNSENAKEGMEQVDRELAAIREKQVAIGMSHGSN
tara:strand:+ start:977 stop:1516 length:540 start_codon:yes stop_codon:yes gene_type:complete